MVFLIGGYSKEEWDVHSQICYTCVLSGSTCMDHEVRGADDCTFDSTCTCDNGRSRAAMNVGGQLCYTCALKDTTASCDGWMQTGGCNPNGFREPESDKGCSISIIDEWSGYCQCSD